MVNLSRRSLLQFGAASGAALLVPRVFRDRRAQGGRVATFLADPSAVHSYEEGVDSAPVPLVDGIIGEFGVPVYSSADATHGALGWLSSSQLGGGRLVYANPATASSSGSVYLTTHAIATNATETAIAFLGTFDLSSSVATVRLTWDARVEVLDGTGTRAALSSVLWTPEQKMRLDWQQSWDGVTISLTIWLYVDTNLEGWRPNSTLQVAFASASPTNVSFGQESNTDASLGFDTYREYDSAGIPPPFAPIIGAYSLHSYDEGVNGRPVLAGVNMVMAVGGKPKYATDAAMHGTLGVLIPSTGTGTLRYDNPYPPAHTGSVYLRTLTRGGAASRIVTIQNGTTVLAQLKISTRGTICLTDAAGTVLGETTARGTVKRWARLDWQGTWDGTNLVVTLRYFSTNPESPDNYTQVSGTLPAAAAPDTLVLGSTSATWKIEVDTLRTYGDVSEWPLPFNPATIPRAPGIVAWAGDATQTTVEISGYTNDTTSVGLAVSTNADMSDATVFASAPPNVAGWNKWSVTGLSDGTQYYHQLTDTPSGGSPAFIGIVSAFKTLQTIGVACTIRLAVGSCEQTTPTLTTAFDDIVAWAPDRTVHLGDFGYPADLSRDPTTHMNNWSMNSTDAGISEIQATGCMDYIISDHDDNGTGNSNIPDFNDPITMANIAAWQQVVPARMEDTQSPPHGRYRADVEGNVRFIKLDTRSIDKSDNTTTATDPGSSASTMLGATQLSWLEGQIDAAVLAHQLLIVYSDCAWNGLSPGPPIPITYCDKWPSYSYERDLISDYAAAAGAQLFIAFGDSHGLQQDDGTFEKNGFATICCGPFDQELHVHYQDSYQWTYPADIPESGGPYRFAQQYHRLTISQDPDSLVFTVTADARDCSPAVTGTPMTVRTMTKTYSL